MRARRLLVLDVVGREKKKHPKVFQLLVRGKDEGSVVESTLMFEPVGALV